MGTPKASGRISAHREGAGIYIYIYVYNYIYIYTIEYKYRISDTSDNIGISPIGPCRYPMA